MSQRNDGGAAFPRRAFWIGNDHQVFMEEPGQTGMTLRDWLAGQALAGLCSNPGGPFQANGMSGWGLVNCDHDHVGLECYRLADAVLAARSEGR